MIPMKTTRNIVCMVAVCAMLLSAGCNTGTNPAGGGGGDKVSLEVHLDKGTVYKQVSKTEQTSEQSVMGMKTKTATTTEIFFKNEVMAVSADGVADIKCTYERVKMDMDNGIAGKSSYDSDVDTAGVPLQGQSYKAMIGRSINFQIDKRGTVVSVSGVDDLMDAAMAAVGGDMAGPEMEMMKKTLKATMGDEAMKSMMQSASIQYPDVLVAEGDTWGKDIPSLGAMPLKMNVTYKVDHIDADKVVLSYEGTISSDKDKSLDLGIVAMEMDLSGKYTGTSEISRKTGMVLTSTVNQDMTGSMKTMGMSIPMTIEQKITVNPY
jgi:predicted small secreted protein